jgi:hypothetical protein
MRSNFLRLDLKDIFRGALVTVITSVLLGVYNLVPPLIQYGRLPDMDKIETILSAGIAAGITYLSKNLLTSSDDELLKPEDK